MHLKDPVKIRPIESEKTRRNIHNDKRSLFRPSASKQRQKDGKKRGAPD